MTALSTYLGKIRMIYGSGLASDERSYYPALDALFQEVGAGLNPKVTPIHDVADAGAGHPDYVLQVETTKDTRASVEAKPASMEVDAIAKSPQVRRYLDHYGLCLVTNLRDFALVREVKKGRIETIMRYPLATTEAAFWQTPVEALARLHEDGLADFLKSALTWNAPISRPKELEALARNAGG